MKTPIPAARTLLHRPVTRPFTCARCRSQQLVSRPPRPPTSRPYSSFEGKRPWQLPRPPRRRALLMAATGTGAVGAGLLAFTDEIKQNYEAAERTGRVASVLTICINDYRTTLKEREKVEDVDERARLLKDCHQRCAERTLKALEANGGVFIKLGQHLSAMGYLLPLEWTTTFVPLQDRCPVSPFDSIEKMFRADTGEGLWEHFSEFAEEPIGAASLAQVHLATLKDSGQQVAVKVQHPGLAQFAPLDLALTRYTFATLKFFFPEYDLEWLASEMEQSLPQELDFEQEARNAMRMQAHFAKLPHLPLVVPDVVWAKKRILVMASERGHRLDDLAYLDAHAIDRDDVSAALAHIFNEMIFGDDAPLHCDPHGGNLAVRERRRGGGGVGSSHGHNFEILLYDHGLYRDIPAALRRSYAKLWLAVLDGDVAGMKQHAKAVAGVDEDRFPLFASAITGRDFGVVTAPGSVLAPRTAAEKQTLGAALQDGFLADLVQLLGQVPRVVLLILKTNDLTRSLDESLRTTRRGPERSFLILARYASRAVFLEAVEAVRARGSLLWPPHALRVVAAWLGFVRVELKLEAFEVWLRLQRVLGLTRGAAAWGPAV